MNLKQIKVPNSRCGYGLPLVAAKVTDDIYCITDQLAQALGVSSPFFTLSSSIVEKGVYQVTRNQFFAEIPEYSGRLGTLRGTNCNFHRAAESLAHENFSVKEKLNLIPHPFLYVAKVDLTKNSTLFRPNGGSGAIALTALDLYNMTKGKYVPSFFYVKTDKTGEHLISQSSNVTQSVKISALDKNRNASVLSLVLSTLLLPDENTPANLSKVGSWFDATESKRNWLDFEKSYFEMRCRYG